MIKENFTFTDSTGLLIHCFKWMPDANPIAVVHIIHGMAEHASRYGHFADFLNRNRIAVYSQDQRGHGLTAGSFENTGHFADHNGWDLVIGNIHQLSDIIKKENQGIPVFILGHSLGSMMARNFILKYPDRVNGLILSSAFHNPALLLMFGITVANIQQLISGKKHRSKLLDTLSFGSFNSKFKPARTKFDWLSCDEKEVDRYINDEFCGFVCTTTFFADMLSCILKLQKKSYISKIPADIPVYMYSGEMDAVGNFTKGTKKTADLFKKYGVKDVELKIYKDGRHEMLNEINKEEVYMDILAWIKKKLDIRI